MHSAIIQYHCGYPAMRLTTTTGTPGNGSPWSSRTEGKLPQKSHADSG